MVGLLVQAAEVHDQHALGLAGCMRCTEMRNTVRLCGLSGCARRSRLDDPTRRLLRCGTCKGRGYCCAEHQKEDWKKGETPHKLSCQKRSEEA